MSAILDTKKKIFDSLKAKPKTLTDLSQELSLSLPTVKEHLDDLLSAGAIKEGDLHGKWKFYEANTDFDIEKYTTPRLLKRKSFKFFVIIVLLAGALLVGSFYYNQSSKTAVSCISNSTYYCINPALTKSGMLSFNLVGFRHKTLIRSLGCSYSSAQPSNFTQVNVIVQPNQSVELNFMCINSARPVHIYVVYSVNGTNGTVVLNVSKIHKTTISTISTSSSTATSSSTVPHAPSSSIASTSIYITINTTVSTTSLSSISSAPTTYTTTPQSTTIQNETSITTSSTISSTTSSSTTTIVNSSTSTSSTSSSSSTTSTVTLNTTSSSTSTTSSKSTTSTTSSTTSTTTKKTTTSSTTSTTTSSSTTVAKSETTRFVETGLPTSSVFKVEYDNQTNSTTVHNPDTIVSFLTTSGEHAFFVYNTTYGNVTYTPSTTQGVLNAGSILNVTFEEK